MSNRQLEPGFIGVFDSGVGGLTVVRRIVDQSNRHVVFVADQSHVPYGGRPLQEIRHFASAISRALFDEGAAAVIMACNISTATALDDVQQQWPERPVFGVIGPGAEMASAVSSTGRVGVLATLGTVTTGAYTRALHSALPGSEVTEVACPRFVPLIERGELDGKETEEAVREALEPLKAAQCDTVVLGCTHYPYLLPVLERLAPKITFVDPAVTAVNHLLRAVGSDASNVGTPAQHLLLTTGSVSEFMAQVPVFLPRTVSRVRCGSALWDDGKLCILPQDAATAVG